jgi:hypothetical protein
METINMIMIIINHAITSSQIKTIRNYVDNNPKNNYTNWIENNEVIDNRWNLNLNDPNLSFITSLVSEYFDKWDKVWSAYQIQTNPHNVHIDEYGKDVWPEIKCWTFVIALDTIPEFKTIIWKEEFRDGLSFSNWIQNHWAINRTNMTKNTVSQEQDLEHTYDQNNEDYLVDYLTLEGIFTYKKGSAVLFDGNKLHCTSNWKKYPQFSQRELLQVHVLSNSPKHSI